MNEMIIELPYPPTVNTYLVSRGGKGRSRYVSAKGKAIKTKSTTLCKEFMIKHKFDGFKCPVKFEIGMFVPDKNRLRDCDNILKALIDSVAESGLIVDDNSYFLPSITVKRLGIKEKPKNLKRNDGGVVLKITKAERGSDEYYSNLIEAFNEKFPS